MIDLATVIVLVLLAVGVLVVGMLAEHGQLRFLRSDGEL